MIRVPPGTALAPKVGMRLRVALPTDLGVKLSVTPFSPFPEDPRAWMHAVNGGAATIVEWKTRDGWPAAIGEVARDSEVRLAALFQFFRYGAGVLVRGAAATAATWRPRLMEALAGVSPDWQHDEIVCLAHLLDGVRA